MSHFSKFIRPGATRIGFENTVEDLQVTAAQNKDGSIAVIAFNPTKTEKQFSVNMDKASTTVKISPQAIQTIMIKN